MNINGYELIGEFSHVGAGRCSWGFAKKGGVEYFIKKFDQPKYPLDDYSGGLERKKKKLECCKDFELNQREMLDVLGRNTARGGNVIVPIDFFRCGAFYYKVSEKVDTNYIECKDIAKLSNNDKTLILKTVAHSVGTIHKMNVVHGDLKPRNILVKHSTGGYIGKIIDMDDSYLSQKPPKKIVGDDAYYSPEIFAYTNLSLADRESKLNRSSIAISSDIFALGIIFHEYLTGEKPKPNTTDFMYIHEAIREGIELQFTCDSKYHSLLHRMLSLEALDRPTADQILVDIKKIDKSPKKNTLVTKDNKITGKNSIIMKVDSTPKPKGKNSTIIKI